MSLLPKLSLIISSLALTAVAVSGCSVPAARTGPGAAPAAPVAGGASAESAGGSQAKKSTDGKPEIRGGLHGSEERVVFDFSGVDGIENVKLMSHEINQDRPTWGQSSKPVQGMTGTSFLHVYVQLTGTQGRVAGPVRLSLPNAQSAVVNDSSEGTAAMAIGLTNPVDSEVVVEGKKVIVNMTQGPMGR